LTFFLNKQQLLLHYSFKYSIISTFIVLFVLVGSAPVKAQEMLGLTQSNYGGSISALSNPASINHGKVFFDLNLISGNLFFRNNFAYIPKGDATIWDLFFKPSDELPTYGSESTNFTYYSNHYLKFANLNLRLQGPSAMYYSGRHGFGISTAFRFITTGNRLPWEIPVIGYESLKYAPLHNINFNDYDFDAVSSIWLEVGLTYAYDVIKYNRTQLTAGITLKPLFGLGAVAGNIRNGNYVVLDDSTINFNNVNADLVFALPVNYDNNDVPGDYPMVKGSGVGIDIGVVYAKKRYDIQEHYRGRVCEKPYNPYAYKIGFSILDIGRINYKKNAQEHTFENVSAYWSSIDTTGFENVNTFMHSISKVFYGDPNASYRSDNFKIGLPTAVSFQADLYLKRNIFLNAVWIQPVKLYKYSLRRLAVMAITPRYETPWVEVSLPVSVYDYKYVRVGLSMRFWFLTIGTERLGTYLGMGDINGLDIYASLKFHLVKGACKFKGPNKCLNYEFGISDKDRQLFKSHRKR